MADEMDWQHTISELQARLAKAQADIARFTHEKKSLALAVTQGDKESIKQAKALTSTIAERQQEESLLHDAIEQATAAANQVDRDAEHAERRQRADRLDAAADGLARAGVTLDTALAQLSTALGDWIDCTQTLRRNYGIQDYPRHAFQAAAWYAFQQSGHETPALNLINTLIPGPGPISSDHFRPAAQADQITRARAAAAALRHP